MSLWQRTQNVQRPGGWDEHDLFQAWKGGWCGWDTLNKEREPAFANPGVWCKGFEGVSLGWGRSGGRTHGALSKRDGVPFKGFKQSGLCDGWEWANSSGCSTVMMSQPLPIKGVLLELRFPPDQETSRFPSDGSCHLPAVPLAGNKIQTS